MAKNIRPSEKAYAEVMTHFKQLWDHATFGIGHESQADFCTEWEKSRKSLQPEIDEFGATFIELARPIWKIQEDALAKASFLKTEISD